MIKINNFIEMLIKLENEEISENNYQEIKKLTNEYSSEIKNQVAFAIVLENIFQMKKIPILILKDCLLNAENEDLDFAKLGVKKLFRNKDAIKLFAKLCDRSEVAIFKDLIKDLYLALPSKVKMTRSFFDTDNNSGYDEISDESFDLSDVENIPGSLLFSNYSNIPVNDFNKEILNEKIRINLSKPGSVMNIPDLLYLEKSSNLNQDSKKIELTDKILNDFFLFSKKEEGIKHDIHIFIDASEIKKYKNKAIIKFVSLLSAKMTIAVKLIAFTNDKYLDFDLTELLNDSVVMTYNNFTNISILNMKEDFVKKAGKSNIEEYINSLDKKSIKFIASSKDYQFFNEIAAIRTSYLGLNERSTLRTSNGNLFLRGGERSIFEKLYTLFFSDIVIEKKVSLIDKQVKMYKNGPINKNILN